jgi:ABC-2 type transport system ATP-binding protein
MSKLLEIRQASKTYNNSRGIRDVSFDLDFGDVFGLLGPNGAGKTTLLKMITGLIRDGQGSISLFGHILTEEFEHAIRPVGCMIESADFHDYITANQHLKLVSSFYPNITEKRIAEVLDLVGLLPNRNEKIKTFSTGMKQKLALAAAILSGPELLILDEPTNGLDIESMVLFRNLVKRLAEEEGTTFIISSHMIHELEQLCNRIGIVYEGKMIKEGPVADLLGPGQTLEQYYLEQIGRAKEEKVHA